MKHPLCFVIVGLSGTLVFSQSQPAIAKTTTAGVLIDVTVLDRNGQPILDLKPDEFELAEDGVNQHILSATLVRGSAAQPAPAVSAVAQPAPTAPATTAAEQGPGSVAGPVVTAILFDRLSPEARPLAHKAALAYIATLSPASDYAGVFLADIALKTFQPFTTQQENLRRAIDQIASTAPTNLNPEAERARSRSNTQGLDPSAPVTAGAEYADNYVSVADREHRLANMAPDQRLLAELELRMEQSYGQFLAESEGQASLAGLRSVVDAMAALQGRKTILYFTENLPITSRLKPRFDALIGRANRANITVYPVDAAGLRVHSSEAELARKVNLAGAQSLGDATRPDGPYTKELERQEQLLSSRPTASLGRLAKETGGFLLENTNDLAAGVARMKLERTTYYLLAYQSTNTALDGSFRRVSVKVKRSKATLRARSGYVAVAMDRQ
jgi:VWFA-related protein